MCRVLLRLACVCAVQRACVARAGMLAPAWVVLIMAGPAGTGAGGACRAGAREVTRGLLALRSSSGLGVPTSCKRAGEEAAATGGEAACGLRRGCPLRGCGLASPRGFISGLDPAAPGPAAGYAAMAAAWLMVPAAIRRSQAARLVMTL